MNYNLALVDDDPAYALGHLVGIILVFILAVAVAAKVWRAVNRRSRK